MWYHKFGPCWLYLLSLLHWNSETQIWMQQSNWKDQIKFFRSTPSVSYHKLFFILFPNQTSSSLIEIFSTISNTKLVLLNATLNIFWLYFVLYWKCGYIFFKKNFNCNWKKFKATYNTEATTSDVCTECCRQLPTRMIQLSCPNQHQHHRRHTRHRHSTSTNPEIIMSHTQRNRHRNRRSNNSSMSMGMGMQLIADNLSTNSEPTNE